MHSAKSIPGKVLPVSAAAPDAASASCGTASLVRSIGTAGFLANFAQYARAKLGAEQATIIRVQAGRHATLLYGQNFRSATLMDELWEAYSKKFCRKDPLLHQPRGGNGRNASIRYIPGHAVSDREYYRNLFRRPGLADKLSAVSPIGSDFLFVNMYRGLGSPAWRAVDTNFLDVFAVAAAAAETHFRIGIPSGRGEEPEASLPRSFLLLSPRERELCVHILRGLSLEGVAMEMRVSVNTAATFKRRAFAKLEISTLKELFHLAFAAAPSTGGHSLIRLLS